MADAGGQPQNKGLGIIREEGKAEETVCLLLSMMWFHDRVYLDHHVQLLVMDIDSSIRIQAPHILGSINLRQAKL